MEKHLQTLAEFEAEARSFIQTLSPKKEGALLVTLSGELGAGKTAFVKTVAKVLGIADDVTSPTFVLEKVYDLTPKGSEASFGRLIHIDAYRLESGAELAPLRFDELMQESKNLIMLEWPEKVTETLSPAAVHISIQVLSDGSRLISYE